MPVVFVHGNPETPVVWHRLIDELEARGVTDVVAVSPPGFGAPTPPGWGATAPEYGAWLIDQLGRLDGPIDLVGHDWGAGHCFWVTAHAPQLLRSVATDVTGLIHPDYVWHDAAQVWRTDGAGEEFIAGWLTTSLADRAAMFGALGVDEHAAVPMAAALDAEMGRCILALYRSAGPEYRADLLAALERAARPPWLVIEPGADPYVDGDLSIEVAGRFGAPVAALGDHGHWWMIEAAPIAADVLVEFWSGLV
ncbi:MAG: alpha/beta fold hydrolase [Desertimonas sp.]